MAVDLITWSQAWSATARFNPRCLNNATLVVGPDDHDTMITHLGLATQFGEPHLMSIPIGAMVKTWYTLWGNPSHTGDPYQGHTTLY
jgi:hypothetical protein